MIDECFNWRAVFGYWYLVLGKTDDEPTSDDTGTMLAVDRGRFQRYFSATNKAQGPSPCSRAEDCARSLTGFGMTDQEFVWLDHILWWRQINHSANQSRSKKQRRGMPRLYVEKCSREKYSRISTDETC